LRTLAARWDRASLQEFLDDMGPRPSGLTLDRFDRQGHYDPLNCRWADKQIQANNQRRFVYPDGEPPVRDFFEVQTRFEEELCLNPY
jgi:hypothetical protein